LTAYFRENLRIDRGGDYRYLLRSFLGHCLCLSGVSMSNHFARKPISRIIAEASDEDRALRRSLSATNLVLLGVGGIIGAGIFVLTGQAAAQYAGPGIVWSFVISGIACAFAGLCYAEFSSMIPVSGSAYTYAYATLGQFIAWIIGWDLILEYLFGASTVAVGWSGYVVSFLKDFGIVLPTALTNAPYSYANGEWIRTGAIANVPAALIVGLMTILLVRGIRETAWFNNVIVLIKVTVLLLFIFFGMQYIDPGNWDPFVPPNEGAFGQYGWSGVLRGAGVIFFAYIGFDSVSTLAQEAKNPQRDMPIGILGSLVICTIFYIVVSLVITGIVDYKLLNTPDPIAVAVNAAGDGLFWLRPLIKFGAIAGLSSVVLVLLMGQPRIFYCMANDGLLPKVFAKIHPTYRTPYVTTIASGVLSALIAGMLPIGILGELVSIGTLLAFVIVCVGVWALRIKEPDAPRPFKTPLVPLVPILGALSALAQMLSLPLDTWIRLIVWMLLGLAIYFLYGQHHSELGRSEQR
jgi:basic amino acid/polyamine antiporter, APA family